MEELVQLADLEKETLKWCREILRNRGESTSLWGYSIHGSGRHRKHGANILACT